MKHIKDAILGVAIGDAVGVPFEFRTSEQMALNPAKDITGYGTHNQPPGTWSDDSSLTFCLAESLIKGYDLKDMSERFIAWKEKAYWTAHGQVFDIGLTTAQSISQLKRIIERGEVEMLNMLKYSGDEYDNGNGSLMRIIPLLVYIKDKAIKTQFEIIWEVSALTHKHIRAAMSCLIYLRLAEKIYKGLNKVTAYSEVRMEVLEFWNLMELSDYERGHFKRVIENDIRETKIEDLKSGGYVIESLEASLWFFLQRNSFEDTILGSINLGHDTDTTAAITGGLAGLYYGENGIPEYWRASLVALENIQDLGERLNKVYH